MNDLIRPSLYDAHQDILPVTQSNRETYRADVVGPICETGDFLARDREIPKPEQDDLLAVMSAGAYGYVMASNYNSRPRPAEVLVKEDTPHVISQRECYEDLIRQQQIPLFLR
jgi:diaminopimelate decarboxylase